MLSFATPLAFLLLLPWSAAAWRLYRTGTRSGILFAPTARLPAKTAGWRVAASRAMPFIFLAGALLMIFAAARPRTALARQTRSVNAIAINMIVDISGSMEALDLTPQGQPYKTRLDVVKEMFSKFVEARPDDLIGLVTFGGFASTRTPLTADHRTLLHVLKGVEIPRGQGSDKEELQTAIGDGLATGVARLTDAEPQTRIIILLSDGESNAGIITPEQAADAAVKTNVRVYTIGVGSNNSRIPFKTRDMFGRETIAYANVGFDEKQLESIAETTKGRYFSVSDHDGLKSALEDINTLETTRIDRQIYQRFEEHFVRYLLWGAAFVAIALTLNMQFVRRLL